MRLDKVEKTVIGVWVVSAILSLTFMGVVIWGIVTLVNHFAN